MAQYTTNSGDQAQPHTPSMVEKVIAKAEGMVDKITGKTHTGTATGMGGAGNQPGAQGGNQPGADPRKANQTPTGQGQNAYEQQPMGAGTGTGQQHESFIDKVKNAVTGHQPTGTGAGNSAATPGTGTGAPTGADYNQNATGTTGMSTSEKIKNMLPGHHHSNPGTGGGTGNSNNY